MEEQITNLFLEYCLSKRLIDSLFINQVFIIFNSFLNISDYLKEVIVDNKQVKPDSFYRPIGKYVSFNLLVHHNKQLAALLNEKDYVYLYNLTVLNTIFHELEHIIQEKEKCENNDSIKTRLESLNDIRDLLSDETLIDKLKFFINGLRYRKYYMTHHDSSPVERMAIIEAYNSITSFIHNHIVYNLGVYTFESLNNALLLHRISSGYHLVGDITNSPSLDFLDNVHNGIFHNDYDMQKLIGDIDLPLKDRLYYGLYLTKAEYNNLSNLKFVKKNIRRG